MATTMGRSVQNDRLSICKKHDRTLWLFNYYSIVIGNRVLALSSKASVVGQCCFLRLLRYASRQWTPLCLPVFRFIRVNFSGQSFWHPPFRLWLGLSFGLWDRRGFRQYLASLRRSFLLFPGRFFAIRCVHSSQQTGRNHGRWFVVDWFYQLGHDDRCLT